MHPIQQKLLFIEDDLIDRKAFIRFTQEDIFPYNFTVSCSLRETKKILKDENFDIIVSDYLLGDGTAFDILKLSDNIPLIIITGAGDEEIAIQAMKTGASDYIIKDHEYNYLKTLTLTINNAINRKKTEDELEQYKNNLENLVTIRTKELQNEIKIRKKAEEEKAATLRDLEQIFNSTSTGMCVINPEFDLIKTNKRFNEMFSHGDMNLNYVKCYYALNSKNCKTDNCILKQVMGKNEKVTFEIERLNRNFIINAVPYYSANGEPAGIIEDITDITEIKKLQDRIIQIIENERQRIGQDLHDGLGQSLTAVSFIIEAIRQKITENKIDLNEKIDCINDIIQNSIVQIRNTSKMLSPVKVGISGFIASLEEMSDSIQNIFNVNCKLKITGNIDILDIPVATNLFYIAKEAVNNSIRHGKAENIEIILTDMENTLTMSICDDGIGMNISPNNDGMGLKIMKYRSALIGAVLHTVTSPNGGTIIKTTINKNKNPDYNTEILNEQFQHKNN